MIKDVRKNKIFAVFLLILVLFLPKTLTLPPQIAQIAIITAIGIDTHIDGLEVSAQIIMPKFEEGFNKNLEVASASGASLNDAFKTMEINLGKKLGLAHLGIIIIADDVAQNSDVALMLKPLLIGSDKNINAKLINTTSIAKEMLQVGSGLGASSNIFINDILENNENILLNEQSKLQNFFINYYNNASTNLLPVVSLQDLDGQGLIVEDAVVNKTLLIDGSIAIFKEGKKLLQITKEDYDNLTFFTSGKKDINFAITDAENGEIINVKTIKNKVKYKTTFKNGVPQLHMFNDLNINLENENILNSAPILTYEIKSQIIGELRVKLASAFNYLKQNNADIFNFYEVFYAFNNDEFKTYLSDLGDENYLKKLELFANFNLIIKS
ncbi:MAG: Ger(x)C family spore germination C-terminal domain-containing protein [Clostridia bacterium]|nr:Ger(x)C family spore germination C-terminal domain-containing protein [Clostridia bacterium]